MPSNCVSWSVYDILRKKSRIGLYTFGTVLLAGGGALLYAKLDDDFRKQVVQNVPYVDEGMKIIFQEEKAITETISSWVHAGYVIHSILWYQLNCIGL